MINIAIFASGSGTNAENLIIHFQSKSDFKVKAIFCNKPKAGVLERAKNLDTNTIVFDKATFTDPSFLEKLNALEINAIVLAGFLWKIPSYLIQAYEGNIINIHPSLLPKYGGKGMYGSFVHEAVVENQDKASGITIHLVNEEYDKGKIIFQAECPVLTHDTPETLAKKIHELEYQHFPKVVEDYLLQTLLKE